MDLNMYYCLIAPWIVVTLSTGFIFSNHQEPGDQSENAPRFLELDSARKVGMLLTSMMVDKLAQADKRQFPGIHAWISDYRKATRRIDPKSEPESWPNFNADNLVTKNPHFWQMYHEIAPGDPAILLLHASVHLAAGNVEKAYHLAEMIAIQPNLPKTYKQGIGFILTDCKKVLRETKKTLLTGEDSFAVQEFESAKKTFNSFLEIWPNSSAAKLDLARTELQMSLSEQGKDFILDTTSPEAANLVLTPELEKVFSEARKMNPLSLQAYMGKNVQNNLKILTSKILPMWDKIISNEEEISNKDMEDFSIACQKCDIDELALTANAMLVARRGIVRSENVDFVNKSLVKLLKKESVTLIVDRMKKSEYRPFRVVQVAQDGSTSTP